MTESIDIDESKPNSNPLSIKHIMVWSFGVAIAITLLRGIRVLDAYAKQAISEGTQLNIESLDFTAVVIAACYGTGLSLAFFAIFGGEGFWRDPGRILVTLLATSACLDLLLTYIGLAYVCYFKVSSVAGVRTVNFAPTYGYTFATAITLWVVIRSRTRWNWRIGWVSILLFCLWESAVMLVTNVEPLRSNPGVLAWLQSYAYANWSFCFMIGTTTAFAGVVFAFAVDIVRRERLSWLLVVAVAVFTLMWCALTARLLLG